jgi:hypothetical protein
MRLFGLLLFTVATLNLAGCELIGYFDSPGDAPENVNDVAGLVVHQSGNLHCIELYGSDRDSMIVHANDIPQDFRRDSLRVTVSGNYLPIDPRVRYACLPFEVTDISRR